MCPVSHLMVVHKEVKMFAEVVVLGSRVGICFSALIIMNLSLKDSNLLKLKGIGLLLGCPSDDCINTDKNSF